MSTENQEIQGKKYRFYKFLVWAMLGAIITYIVCAMSLTTDHTIWTPFYNAGEVSEMKMTPFRREAIEQKGYQDASGKALMEQGVFYYTIPVEDYSDAWNYLCVRIGDMSADSYEWKTTCQWLKDGEVVESVDVTYTVTEGMNVLPLPEQRFNQIIFSIYGENGDYFRIDKVQFRENPATPIAWTTIGIGALTVLCYLVLSWVIWILYKRSKRKGIIRPYVAIEILQELYLVIASRLATFQNKLRINKKRRRIIRTCLFLGMFCYFMWVAIAENYYISFRFHSLVYVAIIAAVAVFSIEGKPTKKNWNNPLVWGWLIVALMMCISDFVVQKDDVSYRFFGYAIILIIGFFIFVWNNMKDRGEIIEDFVRAIHIFFWIATVYCIIFRPDSGDVRYMGFVTNPNGWGKYMAAFWAVVLGTLDYAIRKHRKKRVLLLYIIEACLVFSFAWKTQSAASLIAIAAVAVFWLVRMIFYAFKNKRKKAVTGMLVCAIVLFLPIHIALSEGLLHVPEALGTAVVYEDDVLIERTHIGTVAYAADVENESSLQDYRVFQKLFSGSAETALGGRNRIYREYLRDLNLFGHESRPSVYGISGHSYAHNDILSRAYNYGIFTLIPYVIMLIAALTRTWRLSRKNIKYAAVPFFISVSFVILAMADVTDAPFHRLIWDCMYLLMGCAFCEESLIEEEDDPCYNKKLDCKSDETNQIEPTELNEVEA